MEMATYSSSPPGTPPAKRGRRADLTLTLSTNPSTPPPISRGNIEQYNHPLLLDLDSLKPEERGIRLIQLLLTCAAHVSSSDLPRADCCLRLISVLSSPSGDSMQRLAARLASSLAARLLRRRWPGVLSAFRHPHPPSPKAQLAFARALPYLPFAHAVVFRTLLRVLAHERVVHLVDLDVTHASVDLWAPILRSLAQAQRGLRLTCISTDPTALDSLGSALTGEAEGLDVLFQFHPVNSSVLELDLNALRVRQHEALAIVSILSLHQLLAKHQDDSNEEEGEDDFKKQSYKRMEWFLSRLRFLSPKVVVVAEQEADHNGGRMTERFAEAMQYYGAVFDSVEAELIEGRMTGEERTAVEEMVGREMENVVASEGEERVERHERAERWAGRMGRAGFRQARAWGEVAEEARRVVESWQSEGGGYGVAMDRGCLKICWYQRPLYAVSAWHSV